MNPEIILKLLQGEQGKQFASPKTSSHLHIMTSEKMMHIEKKNLVNIIAN